MLAFKAAFALVTGIVAAAVVDDTADANATDYETMKDHRITITHKVTVPAYTEVFPDFVSTVLLHYSAIKTPYTITKHTTTTILKEDRTYITGQKTMTAILSPVTLTENGAVTTSLATVDSFW